MQMLKKLPDIVTVEELAQYLKISPVTVRRAIKAKKLNAVKISRDYRIHKTDVQHWLERK